MRRSPRPVLPLSGPDFALSLHTDNHLYTNRLTGRLTLPRRGAAVAATAILHRHRHRYPAFPSSGGCTNTAAAPSPTLAVHATRSTGTVSALSGATVIAIRVPERRAGERGSGPSPVPAPANEHGACRSDASIDRNNLRGARPRGRAAPTASNTFQVHPSPLLRPLLRRPRLRPRLHRGAFLPWCLLSLSLALALCLLPLPVSGAATDSTTAWATFYDAANIDGVAAGVKCCKGYVRDHTSETHTSERRGVPWCMV